jgi:hypothetical protein
MKTLSRQIYKIKHMPGRKTDVSDYEWITGLRLNGMIEPSRIFPKDDRELRRLTRFTITPTRCLTGFIVD